MKGYSHIVRYKFKAGILMGFMAVCAILYVDLSSFTYRQAAIQHEKAESSEEKENKSQEILDAGKNLIAHVSQLTLVQTWHFIGEIYLVDHQDQEIQDLEIGEYNTWFKTLFRIIISPNAP
jgi:cytochrome c-type biogenesis protein CcmH/NrfG